MTPAARLQAVLDLLTDVHASPQKPLEAVSASYFRGHRYIGAKDRQAIAGALYGVIRFWAVIVFEAARRGELWGADFLAGAGFAPEEVVRMGRLALLSYLAWQEKISQKEISLLFDGQNYHPTPLSTFEKKWLQEPVAVDLPLWVKARSPKAWFDYFEAQFGDRTLEILQALAREGSVDLRVNTLKIGRSQLKDLLQAEGITTRETPYSPWGLRLDNRKPLSGLQAFRDGLFEIQDEGSQLMACLSGARPREKILDLCAGAGGKTLAMAAMMKNQGQIWAADVAAWRLDRARLRAKRAGIFNIQFRALEGLEDPWLGQKGSFFDRVFLDVPCSGTGTWRRHPEQQWRLSPTDLEPLLRKQQEILRAGASLVRPGGYLVYGTCSLLAAENQYQVASFLAEHPAFVGVPVKHNLGQAIEPHVLEGRGSVLPPGGQTLVQSQETRLQPLKELLQGDFLEMRPDLTQTDGFFLSVLKRTGKS